MKIDLNPDTLVLAFLIAQGISSSALLLLIQGNRVANRFLSALLLLFALWICDAFFRVSGIYGQNPNYYFLPIYFSLAFGPLIWMYTRSLTTPDFRAGRAWAWHLLPAGLQFGFYLFLQTRDYAYRRWFWMEIHQPVTYDLELVLSLVSLSAYLVLGLRQIRRYQRRIENEFSNTHRITLNWLRFIHVLILVLAAFWLIEVVARTAFANYPATPLSVLTIGLGIAFLGIGAIVQRDLSRLKFTRPLSEEPSREEPAVDEAMLGRIRDAMLKDEAYRNPNLNLREFASNLDLPAREVSQQINAGLEMSFIDFVNSYRVDAVKRQVDRGEWKQLTLLAMALDSGFNSKSTFNRVFRKLTGQTPSDYLKSVRFPDTDKARS